jgi:hypothetical protein
MLQARDHRIAERDKWMPQMSTLKICREEVGWRNPEANPITRLFKDEKVTKLVSPLLKDANI